MPPSRATPRSVPSIPLSHRFDKTQRHARYQPAAKDNQNEIVVPEVWDHDEDFVAVTIVTMDRNSHQILDTDIELNSLEHPFAANDPTTRSTERRDRYDLQAVLTHELGHALGLAHNPSDPSAVMYPFVSPGELKMRWLTADDLAGLSALYGATAEAVSQASAALAAGCSSTPAGASLWVVLALVPLLLTRRRALSPPTRRALALLVAAVPTLALASSPSGRSPLRADQAEVIAAGPVVRTRALPPTEDGRLYTEVEIQVEQCMKGVCPERLVARVRGGAWGDIEQRVEGASVPHEGETIGLSTGARAGRVSLYRLSEVPDLVAFVDGLDRAGLRRKLDLSKLRWSVGDPARQP